MSELDDQSRIGKGYWVPLVEKNEVLCHDDQYRVTGSSDERWFPVAKHNEGLSVSRFRNCFETGGSVFEFRRFVTRDEWLKKSMNELRNFDRQLVPGFVKLTMRNEAGRRSTCLIKVNHINTVTEDSYDNTLHSVVRCQDREIVVVETPEEIADLIRMSRRRPKRRL